MIRIHNVDKWAALKPGQMLELRGEDKRTVRLELNCPSPTRVDLVGEDVDGKATVAFLAVVQGHEVVEFSAGEVVHIQCTGYGHDVDDDVFYFTNDGDNIAAASVSPVSFTKVMSRRARNPELERMFYKQQQNFERRMAKQQAEIDAMRAAQEGADAETGELVEDEIGVGATGGNSGGAAGAPAVLAAAEPEGAAGAAGG